MTRPPRPTSTGAARATTRALPELAGRFDGIAVRAPIPVGSVADVVFVASRPTTPEEVNDAFRHEAATDRYAGILGVSEDPLVSADIVADPRAAVVDLALSVTQVAGPEAPRLSIVLAGGRIDQPALALARSALDRLLGLTVDLSPFAAMAAPDP